MGTILQNLDLNEVQILTIEFQICIILLQSRHFTVTTLPGNR